MSAASMRWRADFVAVAERFVGTPYLWGGKSSLGIDCSGLVQVSLNAAGTGCPRDSDMQRDGLGRMLDAAEARRLQRGDLIFWNGHVAIARDADTIVHANAHHMATVIENTRDAIARIKAAGSECIGDQAADVTRGRVVSARPPPGGHPETLRAWRSFSPHAAHRLPLRPVRSTTSCTIRRLLRRFSTSPQLPPCGSWKKTAIPRLRRHRTPDRAGRGTDCSTHTSVSTARDNDLLPLAAA